MNKVRLEDDLSPLLKEIWDKVRENKGLRDGEKRFVFEKLKEIQFMWGFSYNSTEGKK